MAFVFKKINPKRRKLRIAKSERSDKILADLNAYIEGEYEEPMKWLVRTWKEQANKFLYGDLYSIVLDEELPKPIFDNWFKTYSEWLNEKMTDSWKDAMMNGWKNNPVFEGVKNFTFNSSEPRVRGWIQNHGAELVTNCIQEQKDALKYLIAEAQANGTSSAELGRYIRPTIGLTRPQAAANLRHYESTKAQLHKDHPRMSEESIEQKARASAARYAAKQQRYRAETIARTELAYAYNKGNDEAVRQAMAQRLLPIMRKVWSTAADGHVCPVCEDLEGVEIGMNEEFKTTRGIRVIREVSCSEPPIHPRCKCAILYEETGEYMEEPPELSATDQGMDSDAIQEPEDDTEDMHPEPLSRSYINHGDQLYENLKSVKALEGFEDFGVHGVPNESKIEYETTNGVMTKYTANEFAQILKADPEYHGGNIRLLSCGAGSGRSGFAQGLANALGVDVLAPTETLWTSEKGDLFITDHDTLAEMWYNDGKINRSIKQTGTWKLFTPE